MCQDDVRCECGQLCSVFAYLSGTATSPTGINPHVLANAPTRLLQSLQECPNPGLKIRIVRGCVKEHANAPNALALLRARRNRPSSCAAEHCDELAPPHRAYSNDHDLSLAGQGRATQQKRPAGVRLGSTAAVKGTLATSLLHLSYQTLAMRVGTSESCHPFCARLVATLSSPFRAC